MQVSFASSANWHPVYVIRFDRGDLCGINSRIHRRVCIRKWKQNIGSDEGFNRSTYSPWYSRYVERPAHFRIQNTEEGKRNKKLRKNGGGKREREFTWELWNFPSWIILQVLFSMCVCAFVCPILPTKNEKNKKTLFLKFNARRVRHFHSICCGFFFLFPFSILIEAIHTFNYTISNLRYYFILISLWRLNPWERKQPM